MRWSVNSGIKFQLLPQNKPEIEQIMNKSFKNKPNLNLNSKNNEWGLKLVLKNDDGVLICLQHWWACNWIITVCCSGEERLFTFEGEEAKPKAHFVLARCKQNFLLCYTSIVDFCGTFLLTIRTPFLFPHFWEYVYRTRNTGFGIWVCTW